jgi:hypothetical protein
VKLDPRRLRALVVALAVACVAPLTRVDAQELLRFTQHQSTSMARAEIGDAHRIPPVELGDSTKHPRTYWLEGALLGGISLGLLGAAVGGGFCADADSPAGSGPCWDDVFLGLAAGIGTGASFGGLIGGLFKKPEKKSAQTEDPVSGPRAAKRYWKTRRT